MSDQASQSTADLVALAENGVAWELDRRAEERNDRRRRALALVAFIGAAVAIIAFFLRDLLALLEE